MTNSYWTYGLPKPDGTGTSKWSYGDPHTPDAIVITLSGTIAGTSGVNTSTTVPFTFYPAVDGAAEHWQDTTFSTLRGAAGNGASSSLSNDYCLLDSSSTTDQFIKSRRMIFSFNTAVLGTSAVVKSGSIWFNSPYGSLNELGGTPYLCLTGGSLASPTAIVSGDYDGFTDTEYATRILLSSIGAGWKEIPLNSSGLNYIEKTGYTIFYLRLSWDVDNSFGGTWAASKETANRAYLSESDYDPYFNVSGKYSGILTRVVGLSGSIAGTSGVNTSTKVQFTIYPAVDGTVEHYQDNLDFTTLRAAAGNGANSTATTDNTVINASATYTDKFIKLERAVFSFDTSVVGSSATVTSATISIHNGTAGQNTLGGTPSMCITGGTLANHTALAAGDYDAFTDNEYVTRKLVSTFSYNTRYNYDLNAAGLAYISKTDHSIFFFRNSWDVDNSFGGTWASAAYCQINSVMTEYGSTTKAYITVTGKYSGLLTRVVGLSGAIAGTSDCDGVLDKQPGLSGTLAGTSALLAAITLGQTVSLQGEIASTTTCDAILDKQPGLIVTIAGTSDCDGTLPVERIILGLIGGAASLSADATVDFALISTVVITSSLAGSLIELVDISGAIAGTSALSAVEDSQQQLSGEIVSTSTLAGIEDSQQNLSVAVSGTSALSGIEDSQQSLSVSVPGTSALAGDLSLQGEEIVLSGSIGGLSSCDGIIDAGQGLSGAIAGTGTLTGQFNILFLTATYTPPVDHIELNWSEG